MFESFIYIAVGLVGGISSLMGTLPAFLVACFGDVTQLKSSASSPTTTGAGDAGPATTGKVSGASLAPTQPSPPSNAPPGMPPGVYVIGPNGERIKLAYSNPSQPGGPGSSTYNPSPSGNAYTLPVHPSPSGDYELTPAAQKLIEQEAKENQG